MAKGAPKLKKFFKTKGKQYGKDLLATYKGDLNGKLFGDPGSKILREGLGIGLSGKNRYNLKIADGLQDLLHGTLGIRTSHVLNIEKNVRDMIEQDRKERIKASIASPVRVDKPPNGSRILQFPSALTKDDGRMFDPIINEDEEGNLTGEVAGYPNQIHFRSLIRRELKDKELKYDAYKTQDIKMGNRAGNAEWMGEFGDKIEGAFDKAGNFLAKQHHDYKNKQGWRTSVDSEEVVYDIFLYLPKQLSDSVKVTYASEGVSMMEGMFARLFSSFDKNDQAATEEVVGKTNPDLDEWLKFIRGMLPGGKIIQMATGSMVNPMKFQSLEGVDFRTYTYKFTLRPKDVWEANAIRDIIYAFKWSMLPGVHGFNAKTWTFPNEWAIRFQGPIRNWLDFPLTCVCTGCDVDYGGGGNVTTFVDGAPTAIDITLTFTETVQLSRQRYANEVGSLPHDPYDKNKYTTRDETMVEKRGPGQFTRYGSETPSASGGGGPTGIAGLFNTGPDED